jgi:hypothetical protein
MNIYQKLVEVRKAVPYLQKENQGAQYQYVSSSQVISAVRQKMDELGLMMLTEVIDHALHSEKDNKGTMVNTTELTLKYTVVNAEKPDEKIEFPFYAQGVDRAGEKGVGKALTYGEKYFFMKLFNIATDKDDPDSFQQKNEQQKRKQEKIQKVDAVRKQKINNLTSEFAQLAGKKNEEVVEALKNKMLIKTDLDEINTGVADAVIACLNKWIEGRKTA